MHKTLTKLLLLAFIALSLHNCSIFQRDSHTGANVALSNWYAMLAKQQLDKLKASDVLLELDNALLAKEISTQLELQTSLSSEFDYLNVAVDFTPQFIQLTTQMTVHDGTGNMLNAIAKGRVQLEVSGDRLEWFPSYDQLNVTSTDFSFAGGQYTETVAELDQRLLQQLNAELDKSLRLNGDNHINFQPIPLGELEAGTRLISFNNVTSVKSKPLSGNFFVTGSATLIEPTSTSILLDLSFVPDLAVCPADVKVTRAVFSRDIQAREPLDIAGNLDQIENMHFFYTEISGVTSPMTVIHYWFADGQPVAVEELLIEPSERWRTWSSRGETNEAATNWRVLVVEKASGCILHSQSIRTQNPAKTEIASQPDESVDQFASYQTAFNVKAAGFPETERLSGELSLTVKKDYLKQVFQSAIADLQIETSFDNNDLPSRHYVADLLPFEGSSIACEDQKCENPLVCAINVAHCKRLRDTRECSSCLFLNPLNNRCIHMAEDPICVAAKNRQNAVYDRDHESCIAVAENSRTDCQQLSNQITQSCEIEAQAEKSACDASKVEIASLKPGSILAKINADARVSGQLSTLFSNFKISGNFERLQQDVTLKTKLKIEGELNFTPENISQSLGGCINTWSAPFKNRAISSLPLDSMLTNLYNHQGIFTATWSGIVMPLKMIASPLESVFVSNPRLLAGCSIGLTVDKVEQAIVGQDADFFTGELNMIIQPLPTQIKLNPASIEIAGQSFQGNAYIGDEFVSYKLQSFEQ